MKSFLLSVLLLSTLAVSGQQLHLTYQESLEDFANPERGFYLPFTTSSERFTPLDTNILLQFQQQPQQAKSASYRFRGSLIYRSYVLGRFKTTALDTVFLRLLQRDFDAVRLAGLKMILRFSYVEQTHSGNCPDEYKICPPYGDAPKAIVLGHIAQLKPFLQGNADVIAVLQMGLIGIWGENYYTDYFGDASNNGLGYVPDSSWQDRNQVLQALLAAMPKDRMVQVRTPQIKQRFVGGPQARVDAKALSAEAGFSGTDQARIGLHNDCFLASADDYGTFYDYGNSQSKRQPANQVLRRYVEQDSRYTVVGGETCDDAFSPQNDCGGAEKAMAAMHYSYLNAAYNNTVNNDWVSGGCLDVIGRSLGYRFVLMKTDLPATVIPQGKFNIRMTIQNKGYASPYNWRPLQLVLRHQVTKTITILPLNSDIRKWFPGTIVCQEAVELPRDIPPGRYEVLLNLPDAYPSLAVRAPYSIRFANEAVWEPATGYNNLQGVITVQR